MSITQTVAPSTTTSNAGCQVRGCRFQHERYNERRCHSIRLEYIPGTRVGIILKQKKKTVTTQGNWFRRNFSLLRSLVDQPGPKEKITPLREPKTAYRIPKRRNLRLIRQEIIYLVGLLFHALVRVRNNWCSITVSGVTQLQYISRFDFEDGINVPGSFVKYKYYKALRSQGRMEQNANEADRDVHDLRCKPTTCKCQELHAPGEQPGRRMHVRNTQVK